LGRSFSARLSYFAGDSSSSQAFDWGDAFFLCVQQKQRVGIRLLPLLEWPKSERAAVSESQPTLCFKNGIIQ